VLRRTAEPWIRTFARAHLFLAGLGRLPGRFLVHLKGGLHQDQPETGLSAPPAGKVRPLQGVGSALRVFSPPLRTTFREEFRFPESHRPRHRVPIPRLRNFGIRFRRGAPTNPAVTNLWSDSAAKQDVCVRVATKSVSSCGPIGPLSSCSKMSLTGRSFSPSPSA